MRRLVTFVIDIFIFKTYKFISYSTVGIVVGNVSLYSDIGGYRFYIIIVLVFLYVILLYAW